MRQDPRLTSFLKEGINRPVISSTPTTIERFASRKFEDRGYLAALNSTIEECELSCRSGKECSGYNFIKATKVCFLLGGASDRPSSNSGADSGVKFQTAP
jgi:hypothetical protein